MICRIVAVAVLCAAVRSASAQSLPAEPVTFGDGRVVVGGEVAAAIAPPDTGFFNYSDYEHSTLREFRAAVSLLVRATDRIAVLGEVRSENLATPEAYALYARVRPFAHHRLDVQIGRIPPTFGRFSRQAYGRDNPLVGYPLAYQYLTSLRADALPADVDELLRMRGRGWLANYSIGNTAPARGVPVAAALTWDTGVQVTTGWKAVDVTAAVTNGTQSHPLVVDDNDGKQVAARVTARVSPALTLGTSFARGSFVSRRALAALGLPDTGEYTQRALGVDASYEAGHLVLRGEAIGTAWHLPLAGSPSPLDLRAGALSVEAKYALRPGLYAAARVERLTFNRVTGSVRTAAWDAPVNRLEVGGGYYIQRNLIARMSVQFNDRSAGRLTSSTLAAAQLLFWF
jgi:hypothetical protein